MSDEHTLSLSTEQNSVIQIKGIESFSVTFVDIKFSARYAFLELPSYVTFLNGFFLSINITCTCRVIILLELHVYFNNEQFTHRVIIKITPHGIHEMAV